MFLNLLDKSICENSKNDENKLNFVRHTMNDNPLLKELTQYNSQKSYRWIKQIKEYINIIKQHIEDLEHKSSKYISRQLDNKNWLQEIKKKTSLTTYS